MVPGITFISHRKDFRSEISVEAQIEGCSPVPGTVRDQRPCGRVDSVVGGAWEPTGSSHQGHQVQSQSWGSTHNIQLHAIAPLQHCQHTTSGSTQHCTIAMLISSTEEFPKFMAASQDLVLLQQNAIAHIYVQHKWQAQDKHIHLGAITEQNTPDQARRGIRR